MKKSVFGLEQEESGYRKVGRENSALTRRIETNTKPERERGKQKREEGIGKKDKEDSTGKFTECTRKIFFQLQCKV